MFAPSANAIARQIFQMLSPPGQVLGSVCMDIDTPVTIPGFGKFSSIGDDGAVPPPPSSPVPRRALAPKYSRPTAKTIATMVMLASPQRSAPKLQWLYSLHF